MMREWLRALVRVTLGHGYRALDMSFFRDMNGALGLDLVPVGRCECRADQLAQKTQIHNGME